MTVFLATCEAIEGEEVDSQGGIKGEDLDGRSLLDKEEPGKMMEMIKMVST